MAPHLSASELDYMQKLLLQGKSPVEIHGYLSRLRGRKSIAAPHLTNLRRVLKGLTYKRSAIEWRGRKKKKLSRRMVLKMNKARKCTPMGISGHLWISFGLSGLLWASTGISGSLLAHLGFPGRHWATLGVSGLL